MDLFGNIDGLSDCIGRAIQEHLAKSHIDWPHDLNHPTLRFEAFLEDAGPGGQRDRSPRSARIASSTVDLTGIVTPAPSRSPTTGPTDKEMDLPRDAQEGDLATENGNLTPRDGDSEPGSPRRKGTGGLRISQTQLIQEDLSEHQRRIVSDNRSFPKRRKVVSENSVFQPSTLDKLVIGIWEQIHGPLNLDPRAIFEQFQVGPAESSNTIQPRVDDMAIRDLSAAGTTTPDAFSRMNVFCCKVTQASRVCRSIEIIVQARWTELFEEHVQLRIASKPQMSLTKHRKAVFMEACQDFGWTEKELRNKMAIWRGYREVKDAAGWAALVFAGMGIYRFCKYRVGFDKDATRRLQSLRKRLEVAADTLHPNWRQILSIVGVSSALEYPGHPHDWVVFEDGSDPVTLRSTYLQHDPYFDFEHLDECAIDESVWGCDDPRWVPQSNAVVRANNTYICAACGEQQSDDPKVNSCYCFPRLFGCVKRSSPPVQVYRTADGRNNGLQALTSFERGVAVGEFVGLVTKGVRHLDVVDSSTAAISYQIWQGRQGNYTRFINHSCKANSQVSQFIWLDTQRVILVSKGIEAGAEIFVDYGDRYWAGLDKACLCGESCCRYRRNK